MPLTSCKFYARYPQILIYSRIQFRMPFQRLEIEEARIALSELVKRFTGHRLSLEDLSQGYTETEARVEYIDKFLTIFGWDVNNEQGFSQFQKEVMLERTANESDNNLGRPDYRLRFKGVDLLPVEAKKPAIKILENASSAIQTRAYGWTLSLPAAVLTNFASTAIFDSTVEPMDGDGAFVARIPALTLDCKDYMNNFDVLWKYLSFQSVTNENYFSIYNFEKPTRGTSPFDKTFIAQFREWRLSIASSVHANNRNIGSHELGRITQRIMNALLFLRVCEDRNLLKYRKLLESSKAKDLLAEFEKADTTFNAGLFTVLRGINIPEESFMGMIEEMYWPKTKFAFGVIAPEVLASLYEHYLYEKVNVSEGGLVSLEPKPELIHAGGVIPTPKYIVEEIVNKTVIPEMKEDPEDFITILDPACGSGIFLLEAFKVLLEKYEKVPEENSFEFRRKIAQEYIFGIDIDPEAIEVTKLSLQLAILGDQSIDIRTSVRVLPDLDENLICGNTLIGSRFDSMFPDIASNPERRLAVNPLRFSAKFQSTIDSGGFTCIVGNPPYIRIQILQQHFPDQLAYFLIPSAGFLSSQHFNFDVYLLFIERSLDLLSPAGRLGFIIPNRVTNGKSAQAIREKLKPRIRKLVHFGEEQIFPGRSTYTALLYVGPQTSEDIEFEIVKSLPDWRAGVAQEVVAVNRQEIQKEIWPISSSAEEAMFQVMESAAIAHLGDENWVEIFVGVQTSADQLFMIQPTRFLDDGKVVEFVDLTGVTRHIETAITRPAIKDQKIDEYGLDPKPDRVAIFPYEISSSRLNETHQIAKLYSEIELKSNFPLVLEYFISLKDKLKSRSISPDPGSEYWAYGRSQSLTKMLPPKLIVRTLSLRPAYAIDTRGLVVPGGGDGGPYYLLRGNNNCPYSLEVLQALLSNPWVDNFVRSRGRAYRGGYVVHRKAFLSIIPVPSISLDSQRKIEGYITEIQQINMRIPQITDGHMIRSLGDRREYLQNSINSEIESAYGISEE